jgi:hypothetical protein
MLFNLIIVFFFQLVIISFALNPSSDAKIASNETAIADHCKKVCSMRFLNASEARMPPILYSFPGSGNTWTRLQIDLATGIYSGSTYNDKLLYSTFPGESICNQLVSVVKMHPNINNFANIHHIKGKPQPRCPTVLFQQAILLIRDPYDAIFAEFVRRSVESHVASLPREKFNHRSWVELGSFLAHEYFQMFHTHYKQLMQVFGSDNYIYIRYEDLKNSTQQVDLLRKIVRFLKFNVSEDRITCAMHLSDNKNVHRTPSSNNLVKEDVYDDKVVCEMWSIFGIYAKEFGYRPHFGYSCNNTVLDPNNIPMKMAKLKLALSKFPRPLSGFGYLSAESS